MATDKSRLRKSADPQTSRLVKASVSVDVSLHSRWVAAAALRGVSQSAFATEALETALKGFFIVDRRKTAGKVDPDSQSIVDDQAA